MFGGYSGRLYKVSTAGGEALFHRILRNTVFAPLFSIRIVFVGSIFSFQRQWNERV